MSLIDILNALSGLLICYACTYGWAKLLKGKFEYKKLKLHILIIIFAIILGIFAANFSTYIKFTVFLVLSFLIINHIYTKNVGHNITAIIITETFAIIAEVLIGLFLLLQQNTDFILSQEGATIGNFTIAIILLGIFQTKLPKILFNFILKITVNIKPRLVIIYSLLLLVTGIILHTISYAGSDSQETLVINTVAIGVYSIIIGMTLHNKNRLEELSHKYNASLTNMQDYEKTIDEHQISSHENENQLKLIREMLTPENEEAIKFIDALINEKQKQNKSIKKLCNKIPNGGLRATIHLKLQKMKKLDIKHELHVDRSVKSSTLINLDAKTNLDICNIISIYLDNAIEHIQKHEKEKRIVSVAIYIENNELLIAIGNYVDDEFEIDRIEETKYSTKDNGRGYGLVLAKETIENNKKLSNEKKFSNNYFTQILKIKM